LWLCFSEIFFSNTPHREDLAKTLEEALDSTKFCRTLLILDGLDEVSDGLNINSEINQFLEFLLGQPNVVITSRPSARLPHRLCPDLELETIGFYLNQVKCYLEKNFSDLQKVDEIQSFLQHHSLVQSLVRIPIQLDALCYIWDENSKSGLISETMTAIYQDIEHSLFKKDIMRLGKIHNETHIKTASRSKVEDFIKGEVSLLEALAFTGLHNNVINFNLEYRNAIADYFTPSLLLDETLPCLSFLRTSDSSLQNSLTTYHFLHLTYQEYFAARYLVRKWISKEDLEFIELKTRETRPGGHINHPQRRDTAIGYLQKHKYNTRYDIFWRFVTGLLQVKGCDTQLCRFFCTVEDEPRDLLGPVHQRLVMHCLSEVTLSQETPKFNQLREDLEGQLKQWLLFECRINRDIKLGIEIECPVRLFLSLLERESEALIAFRALKRRSRISTDTLIRAASLVEDDSSAELKIAAFEVLEHHHKSVPDNMFSNLVLVLQESNSTVRLSAARALGAQSTLPESALMALVSLCQDNDYHVRRRAADALGRQPTLPEAVLAALVSLCQDSDSGVRLNAADALGRQSTLPEAVLMALVSLCQDSDYNVRSRAADALGVQSTLPESVLMALVSLCQDSDYHVRLNAADALGRQSILPEAVLTALMSLCQDSDSHVRGGAAHTLGAQSTLPEAVLMALVSLCRDRDSDMRSSAADALGGQSILPESALTALVSLCQDRCSLVRSSAAGALGGRSTLPESALTALVSLCQDSDSDVRSSAAGALGGQPTLPEAVLTALVSLCQDRDLDVRSRAADALGGQSTLPEAVLMALVSLCQDRYSLVRSSAADALRGQLTLPEAVLTALVSLCQDSDSYVRSSAARALGGQSTLPEAILKALGLLLKNESWSNEIIYNILSHHQDFYSLLPELNTECLKSLFRIWTRRSFNEQFSCSLGQGHLSVNKPDGLKRSLLRNEVERVIQEAKRDWDTKFQELTN
jgi:HEAT repeat protein